MNNLLEEHARELMEMVKAEIMYNKELPKLEIKPWYRHLDHPKTLIEPIKARPSDIKMKIYVKEPNPFSGYWGFAYFCSQVAHETLTAITADVKNQNNKLAEYVEHEKIPATDALTESQAWKIVRKYLENIDPSRPLSEFNMWLNENKEIFDNIYYEIVPDQTD